MILNNETVDKLFEENWCEFKDAILFYTDKSSVDQEIATAYFQDLPDDVQSLAYSNGLNDIVFINFAVKAMSDNGAIDRDNYVLMDIDLSSADNVVQLNIPKIPKHD